MASSAARREATGAKSRSPSRVPTDAALRLRSDDAGVDDEALRLAHARLAIDVVRQQGTDVAAGI
ncbi:MAG TPA: hypothetical protein VK926_01560, partial [Gaiellaceae bacterium]|nr:hypothetical protein [Gaiellaceae bacterium]